MKSDYVTKIEKNTLHRNDKIKKMICADQWFGRICNTKLSICGRQSFANTSQYLMDIQRLISIHSVFNIELVAIILIHMYMQCAQFFAKNK